MTSLPQQKLAVSERKRERIGVTRGLVERENVYRCNDAIEIESMAGYDVEIKRVFFNDVEMITWHQRFSKPGLWIGGLSVVAGLLLWILIATTVPDEAAFWIGFWVLFLPNVPVLLWFLWPYWYVTIFGRRTSARMCWHFRKAQSWRVYEELAREISDYQQRHGIQVTASSPPSYLSPGQIASEPAMDSAGESMGEWGAARDDLNKLPPNPNEVS
jgi:hypothetical protein